MAHATGKTHEHIQVSIRADVSHLTTHDRQILSLLIEATRLINPVYLTQMKQDLGGTNGIFDKTRGNNYYPEGMTRDDIEAYLDEHPDETDAVMSPFTVVERSDERLITTPYSEYYRDHLDRVSSLLEEAAQLTDNESFRKFLLGKAKAFRTNEYRTSDIDWVHVDGVPLELTIGPYESSEDKLFGVKRDIEGVLGVVLSQETAEAQMYQEQVARFDAHLGKKYGYTASTTLTPMVVMDEVLVGGRPWYGYVPMAYNLPNDADIQKEVGSKKVFIRNIMRAKMELITKLIAESVLDPHVAALVEPSIFMSFIIGHESSHGLSFRFSGNDFLTLGSPLEEGKADVFGMIFLYFLAESGIIDRDIAERAVITNLADGLRQIRFGIEEAHAVGTLIQYNWFLKHGAMQFGGKGLEFKPALFKQVLDGLGDEFYALSQTHNHEIAQQFVDEWGRVPDEVRTMIASFDDIPIDIDPVFEV
ncbi:hypothetical protein IID26_01750 [Patescibacteria group bacterium]|nr:hypothetical protein [Patescibacteria group bacterium]